MLTLEFDDFGPEQEVKENAPSTNETTSVVEVELYEENNAFANVKALEAGRDLLGELNDLSEAHEALKQSLANIAQIARNELIVYPPNLSNVEMVVYALTTLGEIKRIFVRTLRQSLFKF